MEPRDLVTIRETRAAVKAAWAIYIRPRFGVSETWVKITKEEAMRLLKGMTGTADDHEMFCGIFGTVTPCGECVYLG